METMDPNSRQRRRAGAGAALGLLAATLGLLLWLAPPASADVGVERVSRESARPGDVVVVTVGCGFCFPPCVGPVGDRHPQGYSHGPCMLGTKKSPPASFPLSLVPLERAGRPGDVIRRRLGLALPPPGGNDPGSGEPPRYRLRFQVPDLPPGPYRFVIHCDTCKPGRAVALIPSGQLRIRAAAAQASAAPPAETAPCAQTQARNAVGSFVGGFNQGRYAKLDALFAPAPLFQWFSSPGPGVRLGQAARERGTLVPYFRRRHAVEDELRLMAFHWTGKAARWSNFWFEMLRRVPGHRDGSWFGLTGKGAAICDGDSPQIIVISLGGPEPSA